MVLSVPGSAKGASLAKGTGIGTAHKLPEPGHPSCLKFFIVQSEGYKSYVYLD
jgi:hypothetical protein